MRIGIDARLAGETGLGRYVTRLIRELAACAPDEEVVLFVRPETAGLFADSPFRRIPAPVRWYTLAEQMRLPQIVAQARLDLFHAPHWNVPLLLRTPFVVTVHDLLLLRHPSRRASTLHPLRYAFKQAGHRVVLRHALEQSAAIIVPSQATKSALADHRPSAAAKAVVIPEGVDLPPAIDRHPQAHRLLYVGNAYPHKRLEDLLAIVAALRAKPDLADVQLDWIGQDDYFSQRLRTSPAWRALQAAVHYLGPANDQTLARAYSQAQLYVSASAEEGFGLPPLEALAHGLPVAVSDIPAHREVLGDQAAFFSSKETAVAAAVIAARLRAGDSAERQAASRAWAARFSWRRMAEATLAVYRSARL